MPISTTASTDSTPAHPSPGTDVPSFSWPRHIQYWSIALALCILIASILFYAFHTDTQSGGYFVIVCLYALTGAAAFHDAAFRRISNTFSYTALLLALVLTLVIAPFCEVMEWNSALVWIGANQDPWGGIAFESLKGFALCLVIGVASFTIGGLGGGDVKVLVTTGVLAGYTLTLSILVNALCVALVLGILNLASHGRVVRGLQVCASSLYHLLFAKHEQETIPFARNESPFCFSIFIGLLLLPFVNVHASVSTVLFPITG